ncbi:MAG: gliding motility-associated ABC transporter substrate-binding protein GldG, partial [Algoriphagus sp.]|nr:gliding motility-associated ABC transporter substrate-binding protein GldG [Algoriphagus sp.]
GGNFGNQEQAMPLVWPYHFHAGRMYPHPMTKGVDQISFRFASSLDTVKADGVKKIPLLFSSDYSRLLSLPYLVSLGTEQQAPLPSDFPLKNLPLAYLLEGKFTSLFKNRFVPEEFATVASKSEGQGKVVVFGDASVFQSQPSLDNKEFLPLGEDPFGVDNFANKQLLQNLVQYLSDPEGIIATRTKVLQIRPLDKVKVAEQKNFWQLIHLLLPVVLLCGIGGLWYAGRKRRYVRKS